MPFPNELNGPNPIPSSSRVGTTSASGSLHHSEYSLWSADRSLRGLLDLVDRSLTEVRLASGAQKRFPVRLAEFIEEIEIAATIEAKSRNLNLTVAVVDYALVIEVDRQLLASAVTNLLHNAFKFTRPNGHVTVTTSATHERVRIEIED